MSKLTVVPELDTLVFLEARIKTLWITKDDTRLALALSLASAKDRIEAGETSEGGWKGSCDRSSPGRSPRDINRLVKIGRSNDSEAAIAEERAASRARKPIGSRKGTGARPQPKAVKPTLTLVPTETAPDTPVSIQPTEPAFKCEPVNDLGAVDVPVYLDAILAKLAEEVTIKRDRSLLQILLWEAWGPVGGLDLAARSDNS